MPRSFLWTEYPNVNGESHNIADLSPLGGALCRSPLSNSYDSGQDITWGKEGIQKRYPPPLKPWNWQFAPETLGSEGEFPVGKPFTVCDECAFLLDAFQCFNINLKISTWCVFLHVYNATSSFNVFCWCGLFTTWVTWELSNPVFSGFFFLEIKKGQHLRLDFAWNTRTQATS